MSKSLLIFLCCLAICPIRTASAQHNVSLRIDDIGNDTLLQGRIERNVSALLTEINRAQSAGRPLDFSTFDASPSAQSSLSMLWTYVPFRCCDEEIVETPLATRDGYQVRNIALKLHPAAPSDDTYQEAVIDLDRATGRIESFGFAISADLYDKVMEKDIELDDLYCRTTIMHYIERLHTSFYQKNYDFQKEIFNEETNLFALGTYNQYLKAIERIFRKKTYTPCKISSIRITRHPQFPRIYGVQTGICNDSGRHIDGYIFQLWDFINEERPQIEISVWQPPTTDPAQLYDVSDFDL